MDQKVNENRVQEGNEENKDKHDNKKILQKNDETLKELNSANRREI